MGNFLKNNFLINKLSNNNFVRYFGDKNVNGKGEIFIREKLYSFMIFFKALINPLTPPFFKCLLNSDFLVAISLTVPARRTSKILHLLSFF